MCAFAGAQGKGESTFLEEGIATWFQCEPKYHQKMVRRYIKFHMNRGTLLDPDYKEARGYIVKRMKKVIPMVREARESGLSISDITPEMLETHLGLIDDKVARRLCSRFP